MSGVMIVENSDKPLWLVKKLLSSINYDIAFETDNGFEAVEKYDIVKPDLLISDLSLSKSSGLDVLKEIKKNHPNSKIVIVSSIQGKTLDQCLDFGANACISTPFSMKEFVTTILSIGKSDKKYSKIAPVIIDE
ncbi:MAG: response regulator [Nitrosopumilaceae archaeon]|jgi:two-component system chemotaxis response regulator CheY|uniref:Response regulator n=1 Tax=Candidatus Nitrosomaritimum aestuariumsis TaxID=3342354 RepID=A0AC60WA23_9ARCH|nr:response regulator [Nitrosopumilaceae archaeon]MBA4461392.1 response regulator [Nitrosopumilaceae archaeon]MBA4464237.1 response regulator [Nitrosopumilaceae archaeon]NCF22480.1 response regulator [Nitrosopumilaceae archaeon]